MRIIVRLVAALGVFCLLLPGSFAAGDPTQPRRAGALLYKFREGVAPNEVKALNAVLKSLGAANLRFMGRLGLSLAGYDREDVTEESACEMLVRTGAVAFAEPDYLIEPDLAPNDPYYASQWQHPHIKSPDAWGIATGDGQVIVGICDTGVSSTHPDLSPNLLLPGFNTVDNSTNTEPVYNHGTGVAGCVGAVGNNGIGVAGVAWDISLLPIRITNRADGSAYLSDAAEGIRYAADRGARVVNLSYRMAGYYSIDSAAQYLRSKGGLLFVAAGNDGTDPGWPDFPSFIAVGATTSADVKASWSNYGAYIDIVAPGSGVYSTTGTSGYGSMSGTSFSSPIAAGVAALVFSLNPSFTPDQVESFIFGGCRDLGAPGEDSVYGYGLVNAAATLALAAGSAMNYAPVAGIDLWPAEGFAPLVINVDGGDSYDPDGDIVSYRWEFGDGGPAVMGQTATHTYNVEGNYTVKLTVTDNMGATSASTAQVVVQPDPNKKVHVGDILMSTATVRGGSVARAKVPIVDNAGKSVQGATVSGKWTGTKTGTSQGITGSDGTVTLSSPKIKSTFTLTFTVTGVSASGYTYDPSSNVETSDSITK